MKKVAILLFSFSLAFVFASNKNVDVQKPTDTAAVKTFSYPIHPPIG